MTHKVSRWEDVRSQHDAIEFADSTGKALVKQETGKYFGISTEIGTVHLNDNCRAMPKQERELVRFWFWGLGLLGALGGLAFVLWAVA